MARQQLELARDLIKQKRYQDAERLLKTIDHPTAHAWLNKIEPYLTRSSVPRKSRRSLWITLGVVVVLTVALLLYGQSYMAQQTNTAGLTASIAIACRLESENPNGCQQMAERIIQADRTSAEFCTTLHGATSAAVMACLQDRGLVR